MDAIILAGGLGTRLRAAVPDVPKPLAPVNGRPFLDVILAQLARFGSVDHVVLAIGHKAQLIEGHYRGSCEFVFPIDYSVEVTPLGTGGAMRKALDQTRSDGVLVLNGDSYVDFNLDELCETHLRHSATVTMVVVKQSETGRYGSVTLDGEGMRVLGFAEKNASAGPGFVNAGCYLLERRAFSALPQGPSSFEKDLLPRFLGATYALVAQGRFIDIGIPQSYYSAAEYLR